jgi:hypothetical protein
MTTIQAIIFGMMLAWTPSLVLLAYFLWREGAGLPTEPPSSEAYFRRTD